MGLIGFIGRIGGELDSGFRRNDERKVKKSYRLSAKERRREMRKEHFIPDAEKYKKQDGFRLSPE